MKISAEAGESYPLKTVLELRCDGDHEGFLFDVAQAQFTSPDGYIAQHAAAMIQGWKESHTDQGRIWLGPCCSGKRVDTKTGGALRCWDD